MSSRPSEAAMIPLPRAETTPPVTKTYRVARPVAHGYRPSASTVAETGRRLDQRAERAALAEEGEAGERSDRARRSAGP